MSIPLLDQRGFSSAPLPASLFASFPPTVVSVVQLREKPEENSRRGSRTQADRDSLIDSRMIVDGVSASLSARIWNGRLSVRRFSARVMNSLPLSFRTCFAVTAGVSD